MKKLFTLIALVGMSVSAVQCMEPEKKSFTLASDDRVFKIDLMNTRASKKQKTEENDAEIRNEVAKTLVCSYCEKAFLIQNGLTAHQTFSPCANKLQGKKNS